MKLIILMYHGVYRESIIDQNLNTSKKQIPLNHFKRQIEYIKKCKIPVLNTEELIKSIYNRDKQIPRALYITFDDGYKNNSDYAFPVLEKFEFPFSIYPSIRFIEGNQLWLDELDWNYSNNESIYIKTFIDVFNFQSDSPVHLSTIRRLLKQTSVASCRAFMDCLKKEVAFNDQWKSHELFSHLTWSDLKKMQDSGICEIGGHTLTHPILNQCTYEEQSSEITGSIRIIQEKLGKPVRLFCYPNGDFNETTKEILQQNHIRLAFRGAPGYNNKNTKPYEIRRFGITSDLRFWQFKMIVNGYWPTKKY